MILDINGRKFTGHTRKAVYSAVVECLGRWIAQDFAIVHTSLGRWDAVHPDGRCQSVEVIQLELSPLCGDGMPSEQLCPVDNTV